VHHQAVEFNDSKSNSGICLVEKDDRRSTPTPDVPTSPQSLVGRYYDRATGQFLTVDPLVEVTGQPFAYTGDDPVNLLDPFGLLPNSYSFEFLGLKVTVSATADVETGPDCGPKVGVSSDGTVEVTLGHESLDLSSDGAVNGLFSAHGLSYSSNGDVSYTIESKPYELGADTVTVAVTATLSPAPEPPPTGGDPLVDLGRGLLDLGKVAVGGVKKLGQACVDDVPACLRATPGG